VRWNSHCCHAKHLTEIFQPISEDRPCSIRYRLSQLPVFDHIPHLQVLIGNQVVRLDYASCQLHSKIFTLPTYLEVLPAQAISRFGSILRAFWGTRESATKSLECFLGLSQMTGILNGLPIRVGVEVGQSNIQPNGITRWLSFLNPLNIKAKLNIVPIGSTDNPNSLNLLQLIKVQVTSSPQLKAPSLKAIGEGDSSPIFRQLPSRCFVLNRPVSLMLLKSVGNLSFLAYLFANVVVEPRIEDQALSADACRAMGVEFTSPREFFGKNSAISAQLVLAQFPCCPSSI
jgi:hypothetical protein